jgi:hypothetical protein
VTIIHEHVTDLGPTSPVYSNQRGICERPGRATSPALNRRLPRPPPAAPVAGGRGNAGSRRVHSVGKLRVSGRRRRGGEDAVGSVLQVVDPLLDGGALPGSGVDLLPSSSWRFFGAASLDFPAPDSMGRRRIWLLLVSRKKLVRFGSSSTAAAGVGPPGSAIGDFPVARGLLPIQGIKGRRSDGAPPTAPWSTAMLCCRGACVVFSLLCVDLFVTLPD